MRYLILFIFYIFSVQSYAKTIRVAVIDTGFNKFFKHKVKICKNSEYDFTGHGINDVHGHGTNVAGLIAKSNEKIDYCLIIVKFLHKTNGSNLSPYFNALVKVAELKPDIVNLSLGGYNYVMFEDHHIKKLLNKGTRIVAAAGNDSKNLNKTCNFFPACLDPRIDVIGNINLNSNYGDVVDEYIDGNNKKIFNITLTGSSQSAALYTRKLIKELYERQKNKN